ncbi:uncharacterized protein FTOL_07411 [Fusarium torulosum]|uniref:Uncharacterized protein n=1 Tax=Fusarium torulosum TaxID=33205 RepID=A0AAE8MB07_9HYPO|nr:uncharacterized protein FTOL_07411 [Fusarium torulosum]
MSGSVIERYHANGAETSRPAYSSMLKRREKESSIEKTHLITAWVCRSLANDKQIEFLDMGTDYSYTFYGVHSPTQAAMGALGDNAVKALHYHSSFGLESLR